MARPVPNTMTAPDARARWCQGRSSYDTVGWDGESDEEDGDGDGDGAVAVRGEVDFARGVMSLAEGIIWIAFVHRL